MKFRVRTNVGVFRVEIVDASNQTIAFLRQEIINGLRIQDVEPSTIVLSFDLEGERRIGTDQDDKKISEICGTSDGFQLFLDAKFERVDIKKAYVDSNGLVVKEGTLLKKIHIPGEKAEEVIEHDMKRDPSPPNKKIIEEQDSATIPFQKLEESQAADLQASQYKFEYATSLPQAPAPIFGDSSLNDDEFNVRAPDESKRMQLIDNAVLNSPLLDAEDEVSVQRYMQQLSAAGLDEYEIHLECQQMRDELIAKRMHSQQHSDYDVHFHPAIVQSRIRRAEATKVLLLKQKYSTNVSGNGKLVSSDDGLLSKSNAAIDIDSELPTKLKVSSFVHKARTNTSHSSSSSHRSGSGSERLSKVGEQVISNRDTKTVIPRLHQSSSSSSKGRKPEKKDSPLVAREEEEEEEEEVDDAFVQAAIKASLLDIPAGKASGEDSKRDEMKLKPDNKHHRGRRDESIPATVNTAIGSSARLSNTSSSRLSSQPSTGVANQKAHGGPKGRHVLLQRQQETHHEPAEKMLPQSSEQQTSSSRSRSGRTQESVPVPKHSNSYHAAVPKLSRASQKRTADDLIQPHLREHLHHNRSLPPWLAETVSVDTEDRLLKMAIANSLSDAERQVVQEMNIVNERARDGIRDEEVGEYGRRLDQEQDGVNPNDVEYCEEDEMLARALHESMNGF